jgi:CBS domain-containing protein
MSAVHEVMTSAPVAVTPSTSITDLLTLFDRHDYNAFPVLGPDGLLVGIVSKLDILRLFVTAGAGPWNDEAGVCASDVMERQVVSAEADDNLVEAGELMIGTKLHSVPVVHTSQNGRSLVGMLSRGDVLRGLRFELEQAGHGRSGTGGEMKRTGRAAPRGAMPEAGDDPGREAVEALIDQMGDQSFPASDPPAWGVIRARLGRTRENIRPDHPAAESAESQ